MTPINMKHLDDLMQRAISDKSEEPEFFRALLRSTVYAHAPRSDDSRRLRFIQFARPDGLTVLPFFTDLVQARVSAGTAARIVALTGRQLMELTRGATLMLNPNGVNCTLYPEEIAALLDTGHVATVEHAELKDNSVHISPSEDAPSWLIEPLMKLYAQLNCVEVAYLGELRSQENPERRGLLIALAVAEQDAERAARASITIIQPHCKKHATTAVDLTTFSPSDESAFIRLNEAGLEPFYRRSWGLHINEGSVATSPQ